MIREPPRDRDVRGVSECDARRAGDERLEKFCGVSHSAGAEGLSIDGGDSQVDCR